MLWRHNTGVVKVSASPAENDDEQTTTTTAENNPLLTRSRTLLYHSTNTKLKLKQQKKAVPQTHILMISSSENAQKRELPLLLLLLWKNYCHPHQQITSFPYFSLPPALKLINSLLTRNVSLVGIFRQILPSVRLSHRAGGLAGNGVLPLSNRGRSTWDDAIGAIGGGGDGRTISWGRSTVRLLLLLLLLLLYVDGRRLQKLQWKKEKRGKKEMRKRN